MTQAPGAPALPASPLAFALHFLRRYRWWYLLIVVLEVAASSAGILSPYAIGRIVRVVTTVPRAALAAALTAPVALFVGLNLADLLLARASGACRLYVAPLQRTGVTAALHAYLQHHSQRFISSNFAGALANRISETSMGVNMATWTLIFDFLPIGVTLGVAVLLLAQASAILAAFAAGWAVAFVGLSYLLARRCQAFARAHAAARSDTTGKIVDAVTNLASVRLFARLEFERALLQESLQHEIGTFRGSMGYNEKILWFQFSAAAVLKAGVIVIALRLFGLGRLGTADFVMCVSVSLLVIAEARNLSRRFLDFFEYVGNIEHGVRTIVRAHEVVDRPDAAPLRMTRASVELRHVTFGYEPDQPVFRDLSLHIPAGQRVGLVGFSGSGKSTLLNLLLRQYDPQSGAVLIAGTDIATVTQSSLHAQVGLIPQDPGLFHRSLLDNIRYGRPQAGLAEVEDAARVAHAHEFIDQMSQRYESLVGERGVKLSGGQRQRIAIARVVLKDAPILVMDEATASLDSVTERAIQHSLDTLMQGKTVIVVAHRLSTIAHLERILVFDAGRIVEDGSHEQLLARKGLYQRLWSHQSEGFLTTTRPTPTTRPPRPSQPDRSTPLPMTRALVTAAELAALVDDPDVVVIDTRHDLADPAAGRRAFERGHIPGSHHLHLDDDLSGPRAARVSADGHAIDGGRHPLPSPQRLRERLESLGVHDATRLVAVDAQGGMFAARLWWLARWIGHADVAVLDGGLPAWEAAGWPLETGAARAVARGALSVRPSLNRAVEIDDVVAALPSSRLRLIDARAPDRYRGENETIDPVGGHIPGAVNRFFRDNLGADGRFKSADALARDWAPHVTDPAGTVLYCGSGVTACHNLLALEIAGLPGAGLYAGSWSEWVASGERPVAT